MSMQNQQIFVGNLNFDVTEEELKEAFKDFGPIEKVKIPTDRQTGRSRGFAFIDLGSASANEVIEKMDGKELRGRTLRVSVAHGKSSGGGGRSGRSGGGGGGGGGGRSGNGGGRGGRGRGW